MRRIVLSILIFSIYYSCSTPYDVPDRIKKEFYCYTGKSTDIDSLINIRGYFSKPGSGDLFFFNDGIFIMSAWYSSKSPCDYLKSTANQEIYIKHNIDAFYFGIYKIEGRIIKAQWLNPSTANTYYAFEDWYRIIDRNTIQLIYGKNIGLESKHEQRQEKTYKNEKPFVFVSACDTLPVSNTWLKKQRWFWCK